MQRCKYRNFFKSLNINYKNINTYDADLLNNIIQIDYKILQEVSQKLISIIPFIENDRKIELKEKIKALYH